MAFVTSFMSALSSSVVTEKPEFQTRWHHHEITENLKKLSDAAADAARQAYAPYSQFKVGAALVTADGAVFSGGNVENASYPVSICAERVAMCRAIAEGHRQFSEILVMTLNPQQISPCGMCRQMMREFMSDDAVVHLLNSGDGSILDYRLSQLLPVSFGPEDLNARDRVNVRST